MTSGMRFRINIECLENGYSVEVPDVEAMNKAKEDSEKAAKKNGHSPLPPFIGDHMKTYAAKTVKEVVALVKTALSKIPENEYDQAFEEAAGKDEKD
ncbi:MAG: hypothetical protein ACYDBH_00530 [Acidobacteriaceae bacterium]